MAGSFLDFALEREELYPSYTTTALCQHTRRLLVDEAWPRQEADDLLNPHEVLVHSYMMHGLEDQPDSVRIPLLEHRREFLALLSKRQQTNAARRDFAITFVARHVDLHLGWLQILVDASHYQLGVGQPWYRMDGELLFNERERARLGADARALAEAGFEQISAEQYRQIIKPEVLEELLQTGDALVPDAAIILLFTANRQEREMCKTNTLRLVSRLVKQSKRVISGHQYASIPMRPLFSMPREMHNVSQLTKHARKLSKSAQKARSKGKRVVSAPTIEEESTVLLVPQSEHVRAAVQDQQQLLLYDHRVITERDGQHKGAPSRFLRVPLDSKHTSPVDAIIATLGSVGIEPKDFEHVPRVLAGMFMAARRDRGRPFIREGEFWDTEAGARLARIIGFDEKNWRHTNTIQAVRRLMQSVEMHRRVELRTREGKRQRVDWTGPLIAAQRSKIDISEECREGFTLRATFHAFAIAQPLWEMVLREEEGGTPAFMALDARAFQLDRTCSVPFNIYWTIVNRAYMSNYSDKPLPKNGAFEMKMQVLYEHSGLENKYPHNKHLYQKLISSLDRMVECGLLRSWECPELSARPKQRASVLGATLKVVFAPRQLECIYYQRPAPQLDHQDSLLA